LIYGVDENTDYISTPCRCSLDG